MCCKCSSFNGIEKYPRLRFPEFSDSYHESTLGEIFEYERPDNYIVSSEKYSDSFPIPVLTANQAFVLGYTNETTGIYDKGPVILFDDFTCDMKYADFPFKVKSSAMKLLTPKEGIPIFYAYNLLQHINYKPEGHARHWISIMQPIKVSLPCHIEQKRISEFLSLVCKRIEKHQMLIAALKKYKRGLLDKLLEDNSTDANWHIVRLQDVANGFDYGMNSAATTFDGVHKYIRITDIDDDSRQYLSDDIVSPSDTPEEKYRVSDNDILFARTGASVGKSYLYTPDDGALYFAGFLIRISVKKEYDSYFVYLNTLTSKYEKWLRLESMRSGQPGVNAEQYRNYAFRCPNYQTQVKIANIIKGIDLRILKERMSLSKLNSLKNGLLQQLFI